MLQVGRLVLEMGRRLGLLLRMLRVLARLLLLVRMVV